jgi:hypothetical protein
MQENDRGPERWGSLIRRILRNALIWATALGVGAIVVCWLVGWRSAELMGQGLSFAGVGAIAVGLLSTVGTWNYRGNFAYQFSRSASHQKIGERTSQDMHDFMSSYAFMITLFITGFILTLVGYGFQSFGGL